MPTRHLVIGTGIAGLSAAEEIRRRDASAHITMVGAEPHPFYSRPGLAYVLTREIPAGQLALRTPEELRELRLERLDGVVVRLRPATREAELADGTRVNYDRALFATGAASLAPEFPGAELKGVVRLDKLDDARRIMRLAKGARSAVVVGGGSTAIEIVDGLRALGLRTHYFLRGDRYWARVLDPEESDLVEARLERNGVVLHHYTEVRRAVGRRGRLVSVETRSGAEVKCDLLAVAIGVRPRLDLAQAAGLDMRRGILTDEYLETSEPDHYAAGDVAQAVDPETGNSALDTLWASAAEMGRIAGANMSDAFVPYRRRVAMNVTRLAGLPATIIGMVGGATEDPDLLTITRGQSERWTADTSSWTLSDAHADDRLRVVLGQRSIVGAVIIGDQALSRPLTHMIQAAVDLGTLRPMLEAHPRAAMSLLLEFIRRSDVDERARRGVR